MLRALLFTFGCLWLLGATTTPPPVPVTLRAADGVDVFAAAYGLRDSKKPVILLFHQAGSSMSEYAPIAPRLVALGYRAVAIDQRSGGDLYPPANRTVAQLGRSAPFEDVLADMDAALAYAKRTYAGAPIVAWGSSYSAALVFLFAAKHAGEIGAVLAFSPGEYLVDKHAVRDAARRITVPVFLDSASDPAEVASARAIYDALGSPRKEQYVPKGGVHGSSTLRSDRNPGGAAANWSAVTAFLARVTPSR